jgi:hypothetical protein
MATETQVEHISASRFFTPTLPPPSSPSLYLPRLSHSHLLFLYITTMSAATKEDVKAVVEEEVAVAKSAALSGVRSFVAGGVGGVCAVITGHPFDLVKVRLQTAEKGVYKGALDVVKQTIAREGPIRVTPSIPRSPALY